MDAPYYYLPTNYLPTKKGTMAVGVTRAAEAIPQQIPWTVLSS